MTNPDDPSPPEEMTLAESAQINAEGVARQLDIAQQSTLSTMGTTSLAELAAATVAETTDGAAAIVALTVALESRPDLAAETVKTGVRAAIVAELKQRSGDGTREHED